MKRDAEAGISASPNALAPRTASPPRIGARVP